MKIVRIRLPRMIPDSHQQFQLIPSITKYKAYLTEYPLDSHVLEDTQICVVVPAKNEEKFISRVLENMPPFVDLVVVVDDKSTDNTSHNAKSVNVDYETIVVEGNGHGVGSAINLGYRTAINRFGNKKFLCAVMAGDAQMHPDDLIAVCKPIIDDTADHVKGNRFLSPTIMEMPSQRRIASRMLSFGTSIASAIRVSDSQCGFTATSDVVLKEWNWDKSWNGYGYPNYWIIQCSKKLYRIKEVEVRAIYGEEVSGISPKKFFFTAFFILFKYHHSRSFFWLMNSPNIFSILSLMAYIIGWLAITYPLISGVFLSGFQVIGLFSWTIASWLDRAVKRHLTVKKSGRTRI